MTDAELVRVPDRDGQLLEDLDMQPPEVLADAFDAIHARQANLKAASDALEAELRRRLKLREVKFAVFGEWEVEASTRRTSVWDADDLEPILQRLVDDGMLHAGDVADVITQTPVVAASKANTVLRRLTGDAKTAVEACRSWKEKPGALTVVRSVQLPAPGPVTPSAPPSDLNPQELFA